MHALKKLIQLEEDARNVGFDWPDLDMIIDQAISECQEIKDAHIEKEPRDRLQEEIGDLLHSAISMCVFMGFDVEKTLENVTQKFGARMQALKQIAKEKGYNSLEGESIDVLLALWKEAKKHDDIY